MTWLKRLILLSIVMIPLYVIGDPSSEKDEKILVSKKELEKTIRQLEISNSLLKKHRLIFEQEKKRWTEIHSNPVTDKYSIEKTDKSGEYVIKLEIGSSVKNEINSEPITRSIPLTIDEGNFLQEFDLNIIAWAGIEYGLKPAVSICYNPGAIKALTGQDLGVGVYTNIYTSGIDFQYTHEKMKRLSFHVTIGTSITGKIIPGIGIGAKF